MILGINDERGYVPLEASSDALLLLLLLLLLPRGFFWRGMILFGILYGSLVGLLMILLATMTKAKI